MLKIYIRKKNPSSLDSEKFVMKNDVLPADVLFSENPSKYSIKTRFPNQFLIPIIIKWTAKNSSKNIQTKYFIQVLDE